MAEDITDRIQRKEVRDPDRDARIEADLRFMEELEESGAAEEEEGLTELPSLATADLLAEIETVRANEGRRADIAGSLRDPNLDYDDLAFLSGLTRREARPLVTVWGSLPPERRRHLVRAMGLRAEADLTLDFARPLLVATRDTQASVRAAAISALWESRTPETLAASLVAVDDDDAHVRLAAANGLAAFAALAATGDLPEADASRLRTTLLTHARNPREAVEVARRAVVALGVFNDADTNALIAEVYARETIDDRAAALEAMGRSYNPEYLPTVRGDITDREHDVRLEATRALGEIGASEGTPDLIDRLSDTDRAVRFAAVIALGLIGNRAAVAALREHRADRADPDWHEAVDAALAEAAFGESPLFPA